MQKANNKVRIIAGTLRGRKLSFIADNDLRPSPDRVRETLFNWLMPNIYDSRCLDLFAGSGAFGFEALSRGALEVTFVDSHTNVVSHLIEHLDLFNLENADVRHADALDFLDNYHGEPFDIIFLDPPFSKPLLMPALTKIIKHHLLAVDGLLYVETNQPANTWLNSQDWKIIKQQRAGTVFGYLLTQGK